MRPWWMVAVVMLFAGCLADDGPPKTSVPEQEPASKVLPWGLEDCRVAIAVLPADAAAIAPHLPEGFRSLSLEEIMGTGTQALADANLGIEFLSCAAGAALNDTRENMVYASYFTMVEPPEHLRENVTLHFVKWETVIPDDERRMVLQGHGIPAVPGSGVYNLWGSSGTGGFTYITAFDIDGAQFSMAGAADQPAGEPITFVEFQATDAGLVRWHASVDLEHVSTGPVTVELPSEGRAAEVIGTPVATGVAYSGYMTFSDATITLP